MKQSLILLLLFLFSSNLHAQLEPDHWMDLNKNDEETLINASETKELKIWTTGGDGYLYIDDNEPLLIRNGGLAVPATGIIRIKAKVDGVTFKWIIQNKIKDLSASQISEPDSKCLNGVCGVVVTKILQVNSTNPTVFDFYTAHPNSCGNSIYRSFSTNSEIAERKFALIQTSLENGLKINVAEKKNENGEIVCTSTRQEIDAVYLTPISIYSSKTDV